MKYCEQNARTNQLTDCLSISQPGGKNKVKFLQHTTMHRYLTNSVETHTEKSHFLKWHFRE